MLSLFAIIVVMVSAVLAIPSVNRFVAHFLPDPLKEGLVAWGQVAPRLFSFALRRANKNLMSSSFLQDMWRFGRIPLGLSGPQEKLS